MGWSAWLSLARSGAGLTAAVAPTPGMRLAWRELANKLAAYELYRSAEECLPRGVAGGPLADAARSALALGPRRSPWVLEGIAFARAETVAGSISEAGSVPAEAGSGGLLTGSAAGELPAASLLPLHTGAGLAWARRALAGLGSAPADGELARALERFVAFCRAHARPGYLEASLEAVGLVARTLYPHLVARLARAARGIDAGADLEALLWHGAGRGLYFTPAHVLPVFDPALRALRAAASEPEDGSGRANAVAGVAWAITLVNLHDPEVLAGLLDGLGGIAPEGAAPEAFADGVASALVLRFDVTGRDPELEAFLAYRPACGACRRAALWERLVRRPAERALARRHPELRGRG
ncbi:MAG TPA: hypothetical protein VLA75_09260, partial [Thermoanaerobaculia bacterium]|nr:hypothetical protein [Thermoanaerobaculia bacterium]